MMIACAQACLKAINRKGFQYKIGILHTGLTPPKGLQLKLFVERECSAHSGRRVAGLYPGPAGTSQH
jgi:hypothetical protein